MGKLKSLVAEASPLLLQGTGVLECLVAEGAGQLCLPHLCHIPGSHLSALVSAASRNRNSLATALDILS